MLVGRQSEDDGDHACCTLEVLSHLKHCPACVDFNRSSVRPDPELALVRARFREKVIVLMFCRRFAFFVHATLAGREPVTKHPISHMHISYDLSLKNVPCLL